MKVYLIYDIGYCMGYDGDNFRAFTQNRQIAEMIRRSYKNLHIKEVDMTDVRCKELYDTKGDLEIKTYKNSKGIGITIMRKCDVKSIASKGCKIE